MHIDLKVPFQLMSMKRGHAGYSAENRFIKRHTMWMMRLLQKTYARKCLVFLLAIHSLLTFVIIFA